MGEQANKEVAPAATRSQQAASALADALAYMPDLCLPAATACGTRVLRGRSFVSYPK